MRDRKSSEALDDRIAAVFLPGVRSSDVTDLISEVELAAATSDQTAQAARQKALDPSLTAAVVRAARVEMDDAAFRRDRMKTAVVKLTELRGQLRAEEENQRRWVAYKKAKEVRDSLIVELREFYPTFSVRLAKLVARIDANDEEISRINNQARPDGAAGLVGAEAIARGLKGFMDGTADIPRITKQLRLPAFEYDRNARFAWPR